MGLLETGLIRKIRSSFRQGNRASDGLIEQLVAGDHYSVGHLGISPDQYIPDSLAAEQNTWDTKFYREGPLNFNVTDGAAQFQDVLTNGGTATMLGTQAGYEGKFLSTTGAVSGNQNGFLNTFQFKPAANKICWVRAQLYLTDPNVHQYDWYFGMFNTQLDPAGTPPTDGAFFSGIGSGATTVVKGNSNISSVNTQTATLATVASGAAQSIELAVVMHGITSIDFWVRNPGVGSNLWTVTNLASIQRTTVAQRMSLVHYTRAAFVHPMHVGMLRFGYMKSLTI